MDKQDVWKAMGIKDPIREVAEHSCKAVRELSKATKLFGTIAPTLEEYVSAFLLMGYKMGLSEGRYQALMNPGASLQDEFQLLRESGISDEMVVEEFRKAMAER